MGRPRGSRNPDFEATRQALILRVLGRLAAPDGAQASFRDLATAAGVSTATLRHYFESRQGVLRAVLAHFHQMGLPYLHRVATEPLLGLRAATRHLIDEVLRGFTHGLTALHELGLSAGMRDAVIGPAYLEQILEPTLRSVEARFERHIALGHMRKTDVRVAAIGLISPLLVAVLHQRSLGGALCRPLDLQHLARLQLDAFLRAYELPVQRPRRPVTERAARPRETPRRPPTGAHKRRDPRRSTD